MQSAYYENTPLEKRRALSARIWQQYPDRVAIIVLAHPNAPPIAKSKFLAPEDMTMAQFVQEIRKKITLGPTNALFVFVGNPAQPGHMVMPALGDLLGNIKRRHEHEDGFLYVRYALENTFGGFIF